MSNFSRESTSCYIYQNTDTVFVGEVVKIKTKQVEPVNPNLSPELKKAYTIVYRQVTFAITQNFKNASSESIQVMTLAAAVTDCDTVYDLKLGEKWIVFANRQKSGEGEYYSSFAINFNDKKENETFSELSKIQEKGITSSIFGQFGINYPLSQVKIKGYKVTAEVDGNVFTSQLDEYGQFAFPKVPPGTYLVGIYLPYEGFVLDDKRNRKQFTFDYDSGLYVYEFDAVVKDSECFYQRISAFPPEHPEVSN